MLKRFSEQMRLKLFTAAAASSAILIGMTGLALSTPASAAPAPQANGTAAAAVPGELVVGYVGRLAHEKQVSLLTGLQGLAGVRLVVVGDGPQRRQLQQQLPGAQFLGFQQGPELARTFASLDVFVHTGAHETFCQAAQEALASGLPVVAPAAGGLLDLVEPEQTGLLFSPGCGVDLRAQVAGRTCRKRMST